MRGKMSELHCNAALVSNRGENVMNWRNTVGKISPIVFLAFQTFSPGLENSETSKCDSESFPGMVTYILCMENCQSYILTHSCLPIAGRLFYNVTKFHGPMISEWNLTILIPLMLCASWLWVPLITTNKFYKKKIALLQKFQEVLDLDHHFSPPAIIIPKMPNS